MRSDRSLEGKRVRLLFCSDPYTQIVPGSVGTITNVDDIGTVHVTWDTGVRLGLVPGEDRWEVIG